MSLFYYYLEFTSKNALNKQELLEIENFFKSKKLKFIFDINSVNSDFNRITYDLRYETGGGYDYKENQATFVFCIYRGPKLAELKKEIEGLEFNENKEDIFKWLKEKKYIFCTNYKVSTIGLNGDEVNLVFRTFGNDENDDEEKKEQFNLYELNLLLTKIFKIYLVDNAFNFSNLFKTNIVGASNSRNILYKKFLLKYLNNFQGKPYRLIERNEEKPKNLLRLKSIKQTSQDTTFSKKGLSIIPKKIYLRKLLQNKKIDDFINILNNIESETNSNFESKKICFNFINNKINEKEAKEQLNNVSKKFNLKVNEIINYCLEAKQGKKEIEDILNNQKKKISFNVFINHYINLVNKKNEEKTINSKILRPSRTKELISKNSNIITYISIINNFIKENDIKFEKMNNEIDITKLNEFVKENNSDEIIINKIINKIVFIKNKALDIKNKALDIKNKETKKDKIEIEKLLTEENGIREKLFKINREIKKLKDNEENELHKKYDDYKIELYEIQDKIYELEKKIEEQKEQEKEISLNDNVINICDFLINDFFTEKTYKEYGYTSLKNMITAIYKSNIFNGREIKKFLLESRTIKNNFDLYLFFN